MGAVHNDRPETLLASTLTFPAKVVVRYPPPFIEEEGQFQLPLFRHSRHGASLNKNPPISAVTAAIDGSQILVLCFGAIFKGKAAIQPPGNPP